MRRPGSCARDRARASVLGGTRLLTGELSICEKFKMYYVTGGMPEPVLMWIEARDVGAMQEALSNVIGAYERDFAKHPNISEFPKISMIWKSILSQLARENKKFIYKVVKEGARAREYEDALQWLVDARLVYKVYRSTAPGLPMSAYDDSLYQKRPLFATFFDKLKRQGRIPLPLCFSFERKAYG